VAQGRSNGAPTHGVTIRLRAARRSASISLLLTRNIAALLGIALLHAATLGPLAPISDARRHGGAGQRTWHQTTLRVWLAASRGIGCLRSGELVSGWQANTAGLATPISISGALLALDGVVALFLPSLPPARTPTALSRATMLRDGILLLRIRVYRQSWWRRRCSGAATHCMTHSQ